MAPPPFTPGWGDIPPELGKLFCRAFERAAGERPTAGVLAGLACILVSLVLVNDVRLRWWPHIREVST